MASGGIVKAECLALEQSCSFKIDVPAKTEELVCNISGAFGISDKALTEQAVAEIANIIKRLEKRDNG